MNQTVIVFQEEALLAASGSTGKKPRLNEVIDIPMKGFGEPFARWKAALSELLKKQDPGQVCLVLPAAMSVMRTLQIPYAKGRKLSALAENEMRDSFKNEVSGYSVLSGDKKEGMSLCCGGVEQGVLERFLDMCEELGVRVRSVTIPMEGYLRVLEGTEGYAEKTAVYLFFEEGSMTSVLCQQGRYQYSSRSRVFSEPGTLNFGTEIVRSISGILQFHAAAKSELPITDVYYVGCPAEDFEVSVEGIHNLNLSVQPLSVEGLAMLPAGVQAADCVPCIGAMLQADRGKNSINLLDGYAAAASAGADKKESPWRQAVLPAAVLALSIAGCAGVMAANWRQDARLQDVEAWISEPSVQEQYAQAQVLDTRLNWLRGAAASVALMEDNLSTYPDMTSSLIRQIESVGPEEIELKILGFDRENGVLTFTANSREVIDIPSYILALQETGLFHQVDYTGYAIDGEWYTLSLACTLEGKDKGAKE